jgi:hypothetical protein
MSNLRELSVSQAADRLRWSHSKVRRAVKAGTLKAVGPKTRPLAIEAASVEATWLELVADLRAVPPSQVGDGTAFLQQRLNEALAENHRLRVTCQNLRVAEQAISSALGEWSDPLIPNN